MNTRRIGFQFEKEKIIEKITNHSKLTNKNTYIAILNLFSKKDMAIPLEQIADVIIEHKKNSKDIDDFTYDKRLIKGLNIQLKGSPIKMEGSNGGEYKLTYKPLSKALIFLKVLPGTNKKVTEEIDLIAQDTKDIRIRETAILMGGADIAIFVETALSPHRLDQWIVDDFQQTLATSNGEVHNSYVTNIETYRYMNYE